MTERIQNAVNELKALEYHMSAYEHAMSLLYTDGSTMAPLGASAERGETLGILAEDLQKMFTSEKVGQLLHMLSDAAEELDPATAREVELLKKRWDKDHQIPIEEFVAYQTLVNESDSVWHQAKLDNDYEAFAPYLEKVVAASKKMALYENADRDPFDTLLDDCEEGFTSDVLDVYFATVKEHLVPLIHKIQESPVQIRDEFLYRHYPIEDQRKFSDYLMDVLKIDKNRCSIAETEHPFTSTMNRWDVRLTTHYYEDSVSNSMFSVIHEGGHSLYELGVSPDYARTCLATGASCGIHEAQSRFYENIIGRSEEFVNVIYPKMQEFFPQQLADVTAHEFYLAINKVTPSLIRMEADEMTYSLHILIRYEIEKMLFHDEITVAEVPAVWNQKYKEYLGVDVPDNTHGVLQDSHWSGALFGYFPSYSLGSAYGAQILPSMEADFDVWSAVAAGDLTPVNDWLGEHIFKYGSLLKPAEIIRNCCGKDFDAKYYVDYLTRKYSKIYNL